MYASSHRRALAPSHTRSLLWMDDELSTSSHSVSAVLGLAEPEVALVHHVHVGVLRGGEEAHELARVARAVEAPFLSGGVRTTLQHARPEPVLDHQRRQARRHVVRVEPVAVPPLRRAWRLLYHPCRPRRIDSKSTRGFKCHTSNSKGCYIIRPSGLTTPASPRRPDC